MSQSPSTTLFGGERMLIQFKDARRPPEYVLVRELPLRDLPALAESLNDDAKLLALYLDRPIEYTDDIRPDIAAELLAKGDAINFPPLAATVSRRTARLANLSALMAEKSAG